MHGSDPEAVLGTGGLSACGAPRFMQQLHEVGCIKCYFSSIWSQRELHGKKTKEAQEKKHKAHVKELKTTITLAETGMFTWCNKKCSELTIPRETILQGLMYVSSTKANGSSGIMLAWTKDFQVKCFGATWQVTNSSRHHLQKKSQFNSFSSGGVSHHCILDSVLQNQKHSRHVFPHLGFFNWCIYFLNGLLSLIPFLCCAFFFKQSYWHLKTSNALILFLFL